MVDAIIIAVIVIAVFFAVFRLGVWIGDAWLIGREALRDDTDEHDRDAAS